MFNCAHFWTILYEFTVILGRYQRLTICAKVTIFGDQDSGIIFWSVGYPREIGFASAN